MAAHSQSVSLDDFSSFLDDFYDELNITEAPNHTVSFVPDQDTLTCRFQALPPELSVFVWVFLVLVFLLAIMGNVVVVMVVSSSQQELSPSDLFLFHLAVADVLLALTLPLWAVSVAQGWLFGDSACKLASLLLEVNFYTSILFLVCISADRYLVIVRPSEGSSDGGGRGRWGCRSHSWVICGAVWTFGVALSLPASIYNDAYTPPGGGKTTCGERYETASSESWHLAMRAVRHILGFLLPLAAMSVFYGVTAARVLRTRGSRKQRAMRVIVAVVLAFLLCWCPYHLAWMGDTLMRAKLVEYDCRGRLAMDRAVSITQALALLHCCINPMLYAFVGERFRRNLQRLLLRRRGGLRLGSASRFSRSTSTSVQDGNALM